MAGPGSSAAAERIHSSRSRLVEVRERLERLRAGEASTPEDVQRARALAAAQQLAASRAHRRMLEAHAAVLRRRWELLGSGQDRRLHQENQRLRSALVALQTYGADGGVAGPEDRRRRAWEAVVGRCGAADWRSWAYAVCTVAEQLLPGVRGVALSLYDEQDAPFALAESNAWTGRVEEIHQLLGEGPALAAVTGREPVLLDDLMTAYGRWPGFAGAAADLGVEGCWSFPLPVGGRVIGSLTFYLTGPETRPWTSRRDAGMLAGVAAQALLADLDTLLDELAAGRDGRSADVNVAAGMLSVRWGITVAEALAQIRARAFSSGRGLAPTVQSVLDGTFVP